jgi:hypothetical protein
MNQTVKIDDDFKKMIETVVGATLLGINPDKFYKNKHQAAEEAPNSGESSSEQQQEKKKRKGKPITAPRRHKEDGTYDNRPNDPDYFRKYYQERTLRDIPCPNCGCNIKDATHKARHMRTKKCMSFNKTILLNDPPLEC